MKTAFKPKLKVCGIGGGGGNAVNTLISKNLEGVEYVVCNTDIQALAYVIGSSRRLKARPVFSFGPI